MSSLNLRIETERLIIRPFQLSDIDSAHEMNLDAAVSQYTGDGGIVSKAETKRRIIEDVLGDYEKHGFGRLAVTLKSNHQFIGFAGLKYLEDIKEVDLGYRFMKKYWGQGIATEAAKACVQYGFEELNLKRLLAFLLPENLASVRVLEKLNFQYDKDLIEDGLLIHQYILNKNEE